MDRSGAMPHSAWVEIHDPHGKLLESVSARIQGGTVTANLPVFPPGTRGRVLLCTDEGDPDCREEAEIEDLPTTPRTLIVEMG